MKKTLTVTALALSLLLGGTYSVKADEVIIVDRALSALIQERQNLDHEPTIEDLEKVIYLLNGDTKYIESLEGLQYAKNLKYFSLSNVEGINDYSPLESLKFLEEVRIWSKSLNDNNIPTFASHPILRSLDYSNSNITDKSVATILKTPSLKSLGLNSLEGITSLEELSNLNQLTNLSVQFSGIHDFRPVNNFASLKHLSAFGQMISDESSELMLSDLIWNEEDETVTVKADSLTIRLINHDGKTYEPSKKGRYLYINGFYNATIDDIDDFVVKRVDAQRYSEIESVRLVTRFIVGDDETVGPAGFVNYVMSSNGYSKTIDITPDPIDFKVDHRVVNGGTESLIPMKTVSGTLQKEYNVIPEEIEGYDYKISSENLTGRFQTDQFTKLTLYYEKKPAEKHKVTFDSNGGTAVLPISNIISGTSIAEPTEPTRTGYTFAGWEKNGVAWDFDNMVVTEDITLVAQWDQIIVPVVKHTVTFDSNAGTAVLPISNIISGTSIAAPTEPTRTGYTFAGWEKNGVAWDFDNMVVTENMTLVAQWDQIIVPVVKHTVTFDSNGGTAILPISNIISGTSIAAPTEPTRTGYTFAGWNKNGVEWNFDNMVVTEDMTLVAQWVKNVVDVPVVVPPIIEEEVSDKPTVEVQEEVKPEGDTLPATGIASTLNFGYSLVLAGFFALLFKKKSE